MTVQSDHTVSTEEDLMRVAHGLVDDVLTSAQSNNHVRDGRNDDASEMPTCVEVEEKENGVSPTKQSGTKHITASVFFDTNTRPLSKQNSLEERAPQFTYHECSSSTNVSIPVASSDPLKDLHNNVSGDPSVVTTACTEKYLARVRNPGDPSVVTTACTEKYLARVRNPGVGAVSPNTLCNSLNQTSTSTVNYGATNPPESRTLHASEQRRDVYLQDIRRSKTTFQQPYYSSSFYGHSLRGNPLERNRGLELRDRKLRPLNTAALPTYTPSRVYLLSLQQSKPESYSPPPRVFSQTTFRSEYRKTEECWSSPSRPVLNEFDSRLSSPVTQDTFRLGTKRIPNKSVVNRHIREQSETKNIGAKCTTCGLAWWQPLNARSLGSPLPEPRRDVVNRMANQQAIRDQVIARAIAKAEKVAIADKHRKFQTIRERVREAIREGNKRNVDPNMWANNLRRNRSVTASRRFMTSPTPPQRDVPDGSESEEWKAGTRSKQSPDEVSPAPRNYGWPTPHSEQFYTRLTQNGIEASKSQSLTRPKGKTRSPSRWKTENSRYGEHTLMDRSHTKESKVRSRRKVVKETSKPSSTAEKPELLRKAQSSINFGERSEKLSRSSGKKPHPTVLVTKLRQRCQSIGRELDRLAESRRQVDRFVPTDSDETMESLTAANQALHDRLNELQALQLEREKTLKKARVMVEDLITEQTAHAESIRHNVPSDSHASSDSLSPLAYDQEIPYKPRKYCSTERRKDSEVLFRSRGLRQPSYDRTNEQYKSYTYDFGEAQRYERSGKIGERANSTQRILERLREDFAYLSRNVTQIEAKARDAAQAVNKLMQQTRYLDDDQCIGPSEKCEHTLRCLSSQMDLSPRISDSFTRSRTLPRNLDSLKHTPLHVEHQSQYCKGNRHLPYRPPMDDSIAKSGNFQAFRTSSHYS
ncbi:hypothetical protein T265_01401 [Opisthorchis viverrini]|uniref:Uncharacterized protein n=1 Tax=Opisthorchis viverrini TaxID=6198 RepID=A0A075AJ01_OPIVI|nr:hypothetical protein T265_01401 [Opisthorchis viverrini]KER32524.1 hypothetical protein T265_01401 [Opisthorchis viverrini]